jgi:hypothetical protein
MRIRSDSIVKDSGNPISPRAGAGKWSVFLLGFWIANVAVFLFYLAKFGLSIS